MREYVPLVALWRRACPNSTHSVAGELAGVRNGVAANPEGKRLNGCLKVRGSPCFRSWRANGSRFSLDEVPEHLKRDNELSAIVMPVVYEL